jgi:hypothetical protein
MAQNDNGDRSLHGILLFVSGLGAGGVFAGNRFRDDREWRACAFYLAVDSLTRLSPSCTIIVAPYLRQGDRRAWLAMDAQQHLDLSAAARRPGKWARRWFWFFQPLQFQLRTPVRRQSPPHGSLRRNMTRLQQSSRRRNLAVQTPALGAT